MNLNYNTTNLREKQRDIQELQNMIQKHLKSALFDLKCAQDKSHQIDPAVKEVDYWMRELHKIRKLIYPAPALAKLESLENRGIVARF